MQKWRRSSTDCLWQGGILLPGKASGAGRSIADGACIAKAKTSNIANSNNLKAKSQAYEIMIV